MVNQAKFEQSTKSVTRAILLLIMAISPLLLGSNRPVIWALWAVVVFSLITIFLLFGPKKMGNQSQSTFSNKLISILAIAFCAHFAMQILGIIGEAPRASLLSFFRYLTYASLFWLTVQTCDSPHHREIFLRCILFIITLHAVYGLLLHFSVSIPAFYAPASHYADSVTGGFINRNAFAFYIGVGSQIALTLAIVPAPQRNQPISASSIFTIGIYFGLLITLVMTQSRTGLITTLVGNFLIVVSISRRRSSAFIILPMLVAGILAGYMLFSGAIINRFGHINYDIQIRLELYKQVWDMIKHKPLQGFGADSFPITFPQFHQLPLDPGVVWDKAHNTFLTNWAELGAIAGSIPILVILVIARPIISQPFLKLSSLRICTIAILIQSTLHSSVDFSLEIQANTFLFIILVALAYAEAHQKALMQNA